MSEVTRILGCVQAGDAQAAEKLLPLVYDELRKLAAFKLASEPPGQTLQATALVHEAWLRLQAQRQQDWQNRAHFFAAAAEAMRRILIDSARRKRALRHGGGQERVDVAEVEVTGPATDDELLAVHEALDKLAAEDSQKAELVKLRFFVGLSVEEAGEVLGISAPTVKRHWAFAKAWLYREIRDANRSLLDASTSMESGGPRTAAPGTSPPPCPGGEA